MESPSWTATRGGRSNKSLFYRDLSTSPATRSGSLRGELGTPGQAAAAAALWRENAGGIDPPPPPFYTLEDRIEQSPDITSAPDPIFRSPDSFKYTDGRSPSKAPLSSMGGWGGYNYRESTSGYSMPSVSPPAVPQQQHTGSPNWWSPLREPGLRESVVGREGEKDGGSPVAGVVQSSSLLALGPPQDFVRPELQRSVNATDSTEGDEWVTVFGFGAEETNTVMREFEKCGPIVNHISGPGGANWVHLQYQNRYDAKKALLKDGMLLNGALIVGVKRLDPVQQQAMIERQQRGPSSMVLPPRTPARGTSTTTVQASQRPYYIQRPEGGPRTSGVLASPAKSTISKFVDLVFGV